MLRPSRVCQLEYVQELAQCLLAAGRKEWRRLVQTVWERAGRQLPSLAPLPAESHFRRLGRNLAGLGAAAALPWVPRHVEGLRPVVTLSSRQPNGAFSADEHLAGGRTRLGADGLISQGCPVTIAYRLMPQATSDLSPVHSDGQAACLHGERSFALWQLGQH